MAEGMSNGLKGMATSLYYHPLRSVPNDAYSKMEISLRSDILPVSHSPDISLTEKNELTTTLQVTLPACDVNKLTFMMLA